MSAKSNSGRRKRRLVQEADYMGFMITVGPLIDPGSWRMGVIPALCKFSWVVLLDGRYWLASGVCDSELEAMTGARRAVHQLIGRSE